ncbi:MAG TPA: glycosyltransferase [Candidatus Sulfotelmatobacter sp.]|nr:glycosyltransferase [Candidatus Sulfotelmatobacter sp.]
MALTVLSVGFCLNEVGPGSVGGAEQILAQIDEGLQRRGHRSLVVAPPSSKVAGTLIPTVSVNGAVSCQIWIKVHDAVRKAISLALARYPVDIVHMHGQYFADYLPLGDVPTLVTFHLPVTWYKQEALRVTRPNTFFHCVSRSQRESFPTGIPFLPDIENGVAGELLEEDRRICKRNYVALLGRICPEKGFHLALRAAKRARIAAFLAGRVYPFEEHQRYFAEQIRPELDSERRYIGPVGPRKNEGCWLRRNAPLCPALCQKRVRWSLARRSPAVRRSWRSETEHSPKSCNPARLGSWLSMSMTCRMRFAPVPRSIHKIAGLPPNTCSPQT